MRYEVKAGEGQLTYESLRDIRRLYEQGFVAPTDLVRPEGGGRWVPAGELPGLRGAEPHSRTEARMVLRLIVAILLSLVVGAAAFKYKGVALIGLVLLAAVVSFAVSRRRG